MATDWIAVDWGSSRLRAWAMAVDGTIARRAQSGDGMARLAPERFESALLALIDAWLAPDRVTPVIVCGMAGARQGWLEVPYRAIPCAPLSGATLSKAPANDPRLEVFIVPGLSQTMPDDVMRGEETQVAGVIAERPDYDGVVCLPGTHCKWVRVSGGQVGSFRTCMTGELFAVLAQHSLLRHALPDPVVADSSIDANAFGVAVSDMLADPAQLQCALFGVRAAGLLHDLPPSKAQARLSGLLIGAELAAVRQYWAQGNVCIVGDGALASLYAQALHAQGVEVESLPGEAITLAGLQVAFAPGSQRA